MNANGMKRAKGVKVTHTEETNAHNENVTVRFYVAHKTDFIDKKVYVGYTKKELRSIIARDKKDISDEYRLCLRVL